MNVLIVKPGAIGDLLHITPTIRELKKRYPNARITILVGSRVTAELFRYNPHVAETLVFERKGKHSTFKGLYGLWKQLRERRFDLVLNFQRTNLKNWIITTAAFPCRVLVYHKSRRKGIHAVLDHMKTVAALGVESGNLTLEFYFHPEAEATVDRIFQEKHLTGKTIVALNLGASHPVNRWSPHRFAELADMLAREASIEVLVIGGLEDIPLSDEMALTCTSQPHFMTGKTSIPELASLLSRCSVVVSADTGPMHLATAVGTRVVALFGAADPDRTGPVGAGDSVIQAKSVPCVPCRSRKCSNSNYLECMKMITVDEVYRTVMADIR